MEKYYVIEINKADVERFMNEVKPSKVEVKMEKDSYYFSFSTYDDYYKAEKWRYSNCDFEVEGDDGEIIGAIFYEKGNGFCFICDDDGHTETGYSRPDKAESALLEYYYCW